MRTITHIKKKDLVQVMSGKERKKTGKVLRIDQKHGRVYVEKLNMIKRHTKPTGQKPGGIIEQEGSFAASAILLFCEKCSKGVRTGKKILENGKKVRVCRKCGTQMDK